jgi:aspartyl-tRNA(Asn)/glutamyl-tRNA(Gln) amidotransferase subunit B
MPENAYHLIIGLEVHVQLLTQTKLFCDCSTRFGLPPNSATCPVCMGLPGSLPVMNRLAFELGLRAAAALNCDIAPFTRWDRKNYYYPDLPKNYQISQYDLPFARNGGLEIDTPDGMKYIGLIRVHLEEDAGKMFHDERGGGTDSLVDLNRAGTPLLEIVSRPDMHSPEDARIYLEEIRLLMRELGVSDCEMQEGSLRCDANVNIETPAAGDVAQMRTAIVEIKNLNSFRALERAVRYEGQRQYDEFIANARQGKKLGDRRKTTAGWDDDRGVTRLQRGKEEVSDYRYFPEPDLVPVVVEPAWIERVRSGLGELPAAMRRRLQQQYQLSAYDAGVLTTQGLAVGRYFEETARLCGNSKEACNWVANQVLASLNARKQTIDQFPLPATELAQLIREQQATGLNFQRARTVYERMLTNGETARQAIDALGYKVVADEAQIREVVQRAILGNAKAVADFKKGKLKAADAIKGAVMRETRGLANTELVDRVLKEELAKS